MPVLFLTLLLLAPIAWGQLALGQPAGGQLAGQVKKSDDELRPARRLEGGVTTRTGEPARPGKPGGKLTVESVMFFYKPGAEVHYLTLKTGWHNRHHGELPLETAAGLARTAYEKADVEKPFEQWLFHGGPNPNVFSAKAHLYNNANQARLNTKLSITVRAKTGDLLVNPLTLLTDFDHLNATAHWRTLEKRTITIPALAPGEEMRIEVMALNLLAFKQANPNRWPIQLEVTVSIPGSSAIGKLELVPDHFVVPTLY